MIDLTVIVPVYNAELHLPAMIRGLDRAHKDRVRFLVIDDCSSDRTGEMIADAAKTRDHITAIHNPVNLGVAATRNRAFEQVDTRYVGYLDADDWCTHDHFERLLALIEQHPADFARIPHVRVNELKRSLAPVFNTEPLVVTKAQDSIGPAGDRSAVDYPYLWAGIYDTSRLDPALFAFDESLRTAADRPWFWRLYMEAETTVVGDQYTYFYRKEQGTSALTISGNPYTLHYIPAYDLVRQYVLPHENPAWTAKAAYSALRIAMFHISRRERLTPELQHKMYVDSAEMLRAYPKEAMDEARRTLHVGQRILASRLLKVGG